MSEEPKRGHRDLDSWSAKRGGDDEGGKPDRPDKDMRFVSLHHHSTFSYLDGFGTPEAHVWRAEELGMTALALTEHGNVSSHVRLEQAAADTGVKPIFGCELYTGEVGEGATQKKNHLTVLAETQDGYRNLLRVVSKGWDEGFYYEPTVSGEMLAEYNEGLIVLSGCQGSLLATSLVGGKNVAPEDASMKRATAVARKFKRAFGDRYYLEVQAFPELETTRNINKGLAEMAGRLGIPLIATMDCHYTRPSESEMQVILHSLRAGSKLTAEEQARSWGYDVKLSPPRSDKELLDRLIHTGLTRRQAIDAILRTEEVRDRCNVTLPKMDPIKYPLPPEAESTDWLFRKQIVDGWKYRNIARLGRARVKEYKERLKYEMSILEAKGYQDYFLVVGDMVRYAKDNGIPVGPARGSAAASLICYLMRITEVDPMMFPNMVFERFIDLSRKDLPDIDLDFDSSRRSELWDYAEAKYGADRVGSIGTFTGFKSKNSLDDVARAHRIPQWEVDKVKERLIERSSGDLRASATIEDTAEMFEEVGKVFEEFPDLWKAKDLEGNIKGMGVHAAGMIVSPEPLTDVAAIYVNHKKDGDETVISWDKYDAEYLGMLKIDMLGLSTMTLIAIALREIGMNLQELYDLPLDDEKTYDGFRANDVVGIFQFDGRAMREVNRDLKPDNFDEIAAVNALARPGPLHSGAASEFIEAKWGTKEPTRYHPMVDKLTHFTHFQIVYQEQILQIVRDIGHFDWTEAAYIRKIISRKLGDAEFNKQWSKFYSGAQKEGIDEETARKIWGAMTTAGSYAFNLAHCVSYGLLGYWTMWLKQHYPHEFFAAAAQVYKDNKDNKKNLKVLRDCAAHGIRILPPDVDSGPTWRVKRDEDGQPLALQAGFSQIKGIGDKMAATIMADLAENGPVERWSQLTRIKGIGPKTIDKIVEFVNQEDPFDIYKLQRKLDSVRKWLANNGWDAGIPEPTHRSLEVPQAKGPDTEVVWCGVIKHRNLRDLFEVNFGRTGEALDLETVKRPDLAEWVIMTGEDEEELLNITIDRFKYPKFRSRVWRIVPDEDVVLVRGVKKGYQNRRAIYATEMWVFDPDDEEEADADDALWDE